ncbi:hypothetical protein [Naumannella halotolerans]|uniref:Uncharacterized protein n=1 Tax=Naumannella halotolerans TaxID=993414 RepID=A0A4R7J410_9ACTN|nr:hypothetical protein [Naumannella halotolerans]TDT31286.1 hypothetical protein CLV29_2701 [Naumannella halotolerans]
MRPLHRRSLLLLGAATLLGASVPLARADTLTVGDLSFTPGADLAEGSSVVVPDLNWQWQGYRGSQVAPSAVMLARADLHTGSSDEVLALMMSSAATGAQPGLEILGRTERGTSSDLRTRIDLRYRLTSDAGSTTDGITYEGAMLVLTRSTGPAGILVVLSSGSITGTALTGVVESARWNR